MWTSGCARRPQQPIQTHYFPMMVQPVLQKMRLEITTGLDQGTPGLNSRCEEICKDRTLRGLGEKMRSIHD